MVSILPLYSSSPLNTLTLNTTAIHCHQFHTSDEDRECQVLGQQSCPTLSPQSLPSFSFVERPPYNRSHSTASWKLIQQLYGCDAASFTATPGTTTTTTTAAASNMPSPISESDLQWSYLFDHPLNNDEDDRWSLVSTRNTHGKTVENENVKFPAPIQLVSRYQHTLPVLTNPIAEKVKTGWGGMVAKMTWWCFNWLTLLLPWAGTIDSVVAPKAFDTIPISVDSTL